MTRIVTVGEGMVELSRDPAGAGWHMGHGGDVLNTTIHLARLGRDTAFLSAIGDDPFSHDLRAAWVGQGIDPALLLVDPARRPGLYAITTDATGERRFTYWRGDSAAREMFALPGHAAALAAAAQADLLFFSLVTLAILPPDGRATLFELAASVRARGGRVAFDSNYRPALWRDQAEAADAHARALAVVDIGLPTLEDEAALFGARDPAAVRRRWAGVPDLVIKLGAAGCAIGDTVVPPPARIVPRDTSGAGDAFNAGYLHARLGGETAQEAALAGHRLAGWVIAHPGAIPAATADAPYLLGR